MAPFGFYLFQFDEWAYPKSPILSDIKLVPWSFCSSMTTLLGQKWEAQSPQLNFHREERLIACGWRGQVRLIKSGMRLLSVSEGTIFSVGRDWGRQGLIFWIHLTVPNPPSRGLVIFIPANWKRGRWPKDRVINASNFAIQVKENLETYWTFFVGCGSKTWIGDWQNLGSNAHWTFP